MVPQRISAKLRSLCAMLSAVTLVTFEAMYTSINNRRSFVLLHTNVSNLFQIDDWKFYGLMRKQAHFHYNILSISQARYRVSLLG
jgi:hypothetical protein